MAKKRAKFPKIWVILTVVVFVGAPAIIFLPTYLRKPVSHNSQSLAERLVSFKAHPAAGLTADLVPGTVLRPDLSTIYARPAEAFDHPDRLDAQWHTLIQSATFEDGFSVKGDASADILRYLDRNRARTELAANRVSRVVTTLGQLDRGEVTDAQIKAAQLKPEIDVAMRTDHTVVIVQAVFRAQSLTIEFQDRNGNTARSSVAKSPVAGQLTGESEENSTSREVYTQAVIGFIPHVRMGGDNSPMTSETAIKVAKALVATGHAAKAEGNTLIVEPSPGAVREVLKLGQQAMENDALVAKHMQAGDRDAARKVKEQWERYSLPASVKTIEKMDLKWTPAK